MHLPEMLWWCFLADYSAEISHDFPQSPEENISITLSLDDHVIFLSRPGIINDRNFIRTRIPRNAVSRLPALFHKIEANL